MSRPDWSRLQEDCAALRAAALRAADPALAVARHLSLAGGAIRAGEREIPLGPRSRVLLVAFGKAAPAMARAAVAVLGERIAGGIVVHPYGTDPCGEWPDAILRLTAGHPLPDERSLAAGEAIRSLLAGAAAWDVVLALVSGGGSALVEIPRPGLGLADLRGVTDAILRSGAGIDELNAVRRGLSEIKGGGLLRLAHPARVVALLLSDVTGDPLPAIASGPTVAGDPDAAAREALAVLERRCMTPSFPGVAAALGGSRGAARRAGAVAVPPVNVIVGSNRAAAAAVAQEARSLGFRARVATLRLRGEAREAGRRIASFARSAGARRRAPLCVVLGGETTVTVRGDGAGGRNQELALAAAIEMDGAHRVAVLAFATDGVDGTSPAAGAIATGETAARARAAGIAAGDCLARNDSGGFFEAIGDAIATGPTGTNVNDLVAVLVYPIAGAVTRAARAGG